MTLLLLPWCVFVVLAALSPSGAGARLGPYSLGWLSINVLNVVWTIAFLWGVRLRSASLVVIALAAMYLSTLLAFSNSSFSAHAAAVPLTLASRFGLGLSAVALAATWRRRNPAKRASRLLLGAGSLLLAFATFDSLLPVLAQATKPAVPLKVEFREALPPPTLGPSSVAVVGDSVVWGPGVEVEETFEYRLEEALARSKPGVRVYNLGLGGTGPTEYLSTLKQLPPVALVVVGFYINDIPERLRPGFRFRQVLGNLGKTSLLCRFGVDYSGAALYRDVDRYLEYVIGDWDESDATFERRWKKLSEQMRALGAEARQKSQAPPILLLFPMVCDFRQYPVPNAHGRMRQLGRECGFEVIDFLPEFLEAFPDGRQHLLPMDNHFDGAVHEFVAKRLERPAREALGIDR